MRPSRIPVLVALAVLAGLVVYLLVRLDYGAAPSLQLFAPVLLGVIGLLDVVTASSVRARVQRQPRARTMRPLHPIAVARLVALGKASALVGALAAGAYAGFFAFTITHLDLTAAQGDAPVSGGGLAASALLGVGGLLLERAGRTPEPPPTADDWHL